MLDAPAPAPAPAQGIRTVSFPPPPGGPVYLGLAGYARSGKDTVARHLVWEHGFTEVKFSSILKAMLYRLDPTVSVYRGPSVISYVTCPLSELVDERGWDWLKDNSPETRRMLQVLGTEAGRDLLGPDVWVNAAFSTLPGSAHGRYVFSDVRFPNEAAPMTHLWHIIRPGFGPVNDHSSEAMPGTPDATLHNTGTVKDLWKEADDALARTVFHSEA